MLFVVAASAAEGKTTARPKDQHDDDANNPLNDRALVFNKGNALMVAGGAVSIDGCYSMSEIIFDMNLLNRLHRLHRLHHLLLRWVLHWGWSHCLMLMLFLFI